MVFLAGKKGQKPRNQLIFGVMALLFGALGLGLFVADEKDKRVVNSTAGLADCKGTLRTLESLIKAKLTVVTGTEEVKAIAEQMLAEIARSPCKP